MTKEKQIEEMANDLCHSPNCDLKKIGKNCYKGCKAYIYAERAINKGYCKASEIFEEIEYLIWQNDTHPALELTEAIAELKKKYTESEKDDG
jgi:hypothetical protein